jgi:N,N'-diacetyllegionaminate synthase
MEINVGGNWIGSKHSPMVVAEIGANHDGSLEKASRMIDAIADAGAKAVKFQLYSAEELVADVCRVTEWGPAGHRVKEPVGEMFKRLSLSKQSMAELFKQAKKRGMLPFASPFSEKGVDFLMDLDVACIKIAASDVTHLPLLRYVAKTSRPVILSLGKCTLAEADSAIECLWGAGCKDLAILHCVSTYPSPMQEMNLRVIPALQSLYPECVVGFSDHSLGITAAIGAVALGASIVEKHVTLNRSDSGPDHWFSLDMNDLRLLVSGVEDIYSALGHPRKQVLSCESEGKDKATRSLIATKMIKAGSILKNADIKIVRPGNGIAPGFIDMIVGMTICKDIDENTVITWDHFKTTN